MTIPMRASFLITTLLLGGISAPSSAQQSVVDTVHNLSAGGPGVVRAASEQQVCIFCHAPHHTTGMAPLWNRELSTANYTIYSSTTLDAHPGQPTGSSKFCLSCHDGTIALGNVASRPSPIDMLGSPVMPAGLRNLGTDLSDDHPISFVYSPALAAADPELRHPSTLPSALRLDAAGQVQCTTCHEPHANLHGKFLVMDQRSGGLCIACHQRSGWAGSSHALSPAPMPPAGAFNYATVAENACQACHQPHAAGSHAGLLRSSLEENNCLNCHGSPSTAYDLQREINKPFGHDPRGTAGVHDPVEDGFGSTPHAECADCHDPHGARAPSLLSGYQPIGQTLLGARGVSIGGAPLANAQFEYEVCLRCHGDSTVPVPQRIVRVFDTPNLRQRFSTGNASFHPVAGPTPGISVPSLVSGLTPGSQLRCTDCHNNDSTRRSGGIGPDGPHGSIHEWLLEKNYSTRDPNPESAFEYALCYKCHDRASILNDESFPTHAKHVREEDTPCTVCHDPHGVPGLAGNPSSRTHLVNFRLSAVLPSPTTGTIRFEDRGFRRGSCTLMCHGENHVDKGY